MALFDQTLIVEICTQVAQHYEALGAALGQSGQPIDTCRLAPTAPLVEHLTRLISIANGEQIRGEASKADVAQVEATLTQVQLMLFGNPMQSSINLPVDFWQTDTGILFSRVRWWLSADELITISNAAALAFGENTQAARMRIVRAIDSGQLDWVPDPSVANPQQNRRVLRPQVERLAAQRRRPE
ncbi:MAG: hypothetical protein AAF702_09280 [Chloroflexota bacterium]